MENFRYVPEAEKRHVYTPQRALLLRAESLAIDASSLTPEQHTILRDTTRAMAEGFVQTYGQFMKKSKRNLLEGVESRVFAVDSDTFDVFYYYHREGVDIDRPDPQAIGVNQPTVSTMGIDVSQAFSKPAKGTSEAIQRSGKTIMLTHTLPRTLGHEIGHHFGDDYIYSGKMKLFCEAGATYYGEEMYKKTVSKPRQAMNAILQYTDPHFLAKSRQPLIDLYAELINMYGDEVHRYFFGTHTRYRVVHKIRNHFTDELLASYRGFFRKGFI